MDSRRTRLLWFYASTLKIDVYQRHFRSFHQQCIKRTLAFGTWGKVAPSFLSLCINDLPSNLYLVNGDAFSSNSVRSSCLPRLSRRRRRASRYNIPAEKSNKWVVHVGRDFFFFQFCATHDLLVTPHEVFGLKDLRLSAIFTFVS